MNQTDGKVLPYLVFINSDGSIFKREIGYSPGGDWQLKRDIEALLNIDKARNNE